MLCSWPLTILSLLVGVPEPVELIRDPHFQTGFRVIAPTEGKRIIEGELRVDPDAEPVWDLAQWNTRQSLVSATAERTDTGTRFADPYKIVAVGTADGESADLTLAVNGIAEYQGVARQKGQRWPHLLVSQRLNAPLRLSGIAALPFHLEARLSHLEKLETDDYTPRLHAAQFQWFITIQNLNRESPGYGDFYWFGVSLYDDRKEVRGRAIIPGDQGLGKLIYSPPSDTWADESTHTGNWVTFAGDLLPEILAGLQTAWDRGFLKDSHDLADYTLGGMNIGWEVPGLFDCAMQLRNFSLQMQAGTPPVPAE